MPISASDAAPAPGIVARRGPRPAAIALVAAVVIGCVRVPPADLSRDPSALLDQVRAAQARVSRVSGSARVSIQSPGGSGTVAEFAAAEKPDRVHLETLDFFGSPVSVLVAANGRFAFLDKRANVLYRGEATPENVSRLLPVMLPIEELVTILCGSAPLLGGVPVEARVDGGSLLLTLARGDVGQRLAIGERASVESSRVRLSQVAADGTRREVNPAYDLEFGDFLERAGVRFPSDVRLDAPAGRARVHLAWEDLEVNGSVDPKLFELAPPRGVRVVELAAGATLPFDGPAGGPRE
jgi:Domain of unknown function (DUF4292)